MRTQSCFLVAMVVAQSIVRVAGAQQAPLAGFDDYVRQAMKDWEVPGAAIAVIKDDRVILSKGYGVRKLGDPTPVDERTLFAIGSSGKAFTAAAIAMLVDDGKLQFDDPVIDHLPTFELFDPQVTREMTVRDLLTHRSGLDRGEYMWYAWGWDRDEVLRRLRYQKPAWSFRSKFGYNNIMFLAAGQLIPRLTGQSYDDFIIRRIFQPLGMTSSNMTVTAFKNGDDVSTPHAKLGDKIEPIAWHNSDNIAPAGSINSNVVDMVQWLRFQLGGGTFDGRQLIKPATFKEMHTPQTVIRLEGSQTRLYPEAHFLDYGMGWFLSDYRGHVMVEHGGNVDGESAQVTMIPDLKLGLVILTNLNGSSMRTGLMYRVLDAFLGAPPRDWSTEIHTTLRNAQEKAVAAQKARDAERVQGTTPSLALAQYAGTYRNEFYGEVNVSYEQGKLVARFGKPEFASELEHWQYDTFRAHWNSPTLREAKMTFVLSTAGKADELRFDLPGMQADYPFRRLPPVPNAAKAP